MILWTICICLIFGNKIVSIFVIMVCYITLSFYIPVIDLFFYNMDIDIDCLLITPIGAVIVFFRNILLFESHNQNY